MVVEADDVGAGLAYSPLSSAACSAGQLLAGRRLPRGDQNAVSDPVVAVVGQECVWYNDIEEGFNISRFEEFGRIADYWCNQTELEHRVRGYFERFMKAVRGHD